MDGGPRLALLALMVAILTALSTWYTWGAAEPLPIVQDEYSYVLQSEIFASGRWTVPSPPVPSSFQQPHVLTAPRVGSKFPPGHALTLAPGSAVGRPWLMVLVLAALSGVLVFLVTEKVSGPWIALGAWAFWLSDPIGLRFRAGYYSELTAGLMWLAAWWCLDRWADTGQRPWLLALAAAVGWNAITRPLSALALAVPIGAFVVARIAFVVARIAQRRQWRDLGIALLVGTLLVAVLPLWSWRTTGSATESPLRLYRAQHLPFDKLGFGLDTTPPQLRLSPVNADVYAEFAPEHSQHTLMALPRIAARRLTTLATAEFAGWRIVLVPLVVLGAVVGGAQLWFVGLCALSLFVAYLFYAHWPGWTLYYFEALPAVAFFAAAGLSTSARWLAARSEWRRAEWAGAALLAGALAISSVANVVDWRRTHAAAARYDTAFREMVERLPFAGSVIFVRYAPDLHPHTTVVGNSATLDTDRVWVAIDDPSKNMEVLRSARGRTPLLFEERGSQLRVYTELVDSIAGQRRIEQ